MKRIIMILAAIAILSTGAIFVDQQGLIVHLSVENMTYSLRGIINLDSRSNMTENLNLLEKPLLS